VPEKPSDSSGAITIIIIVVGGGGGGGAKTAIAVAMVRGDVEYRNGSTPPHGCRSHVGSTRNKQSRTLSRPSTDASRLASKVVLGLSLL
jgi:acetyl-CoA carboxylase alpha subunit